MTLVTGYRVLETIHKADGVVVSRAVWGVDGRADFYALGATLYELLIGRPLFETSDALVLVHAHLARMPKVPHLLRDGVPEALSRIVMKLLAKDPENRYQSAWGLTFDLEECRKAASEGDIPLFPLGLRDVSERFRIPQKLYGRENEIEALLSAFNRVCRGEKELVLVAGEPGIGKTSLVRECHRPITSRRGWFVSGKFDQLQRNVPYSGIIQAFSELMRGILAESEDRLSGWRENLRAALGNIGRVMTGRHLRSGTDHQTNEERRTFKIKSYVEDVLRSLHPRIKRTGTPST
jgi:histidine kinase